MKTNSSEMAIQLRTEVEFDAAHRLVGYNGECSQLHGHTWRVVVEVFGSRSQKDSTGILLDFKVVKRMVREFDHKTILYDCKENKLLASTLSISNDGAGLKLMNCNPTAENLAMYFWKVLKKINSELHYGVEVWESKTSFAKVA